MICGAHVMIFTQDEAADRAFFRDILELPSVDAGGGWLIFKLPPGELGIHGHQHNDIHQVYLMCDDVDAEVERLAARGVECGPVETRSWGRATAIPLPGGGRIGLYEAQHARP